MSKRGRGGKSKSANTSHVDDEEVSDTKSSKKQKTTTTTTDLSESDTKNFLKFYNALPAKDHDLVRFFVRKDWYTVYDEDASLIAEEYFKTSRAVKSWKDNKGPKYLDIKPNQFQEICRTLLFDKKSRLEVYSNEPGKWELIQQASPGNVAQLEDILYADGEMHDSQVMMAVFISNTSGSRVVGLSYVDVTLKYLGTTQFEDNDQLTSLESALYQIGGKECYCLALDTKDKDSQKLHAMLNAMNIKVTTRKKPDFKCLDNMEQDLKRLLGKKYWASVPEMENKAAMGSLSALIIGMELLVREEFFEAFELKTFSVDEFMRLDSTAISALNVLPNPREPSLKQDLFGLLNKCRTTMGSRMLMQWLKQPLKDIQKIKRRLDLVEIFYSDETLTKELRTQCLKRIPDLERIAKKLHAGRAGLHETVNIYQFVQTLPQFIQVLEACDDKNALLENNFTKKFEILKNEFKAFEDLVEETVDLQGIVKGEYHVNASYDEALQQLSEAKKSIAKKLDQHEDDTRSLLKDPGSFKMEQDRTHGFFFRVTRKDESCIEQNKKKNFTILHSQKVVKFRDAKLEKLSDEYFELNKQYEEQSKELVKEIMKIAGSYMPVLEESHSLLAEIDVLSTLGYVAFSAPYPYVKPVVTPMGTGELVLKQARHPILEALPDTTFIPNNAVLKKGSSSFLIITGPNMGGKSTFIRSVGINVLLAQIGSFVACSEATVPVCDAILARIGASDSQLRGISTFMAEMLETSNILNTATANSLVIIDELGRGTSTYDGFGLAWAISEWICNSIKSFCLFATHFHELTQLEHEIPCVKNFHVAAEPDKEGFGLTLLYELQPGPSDQSFGIHVAKIANFPEEVIEVARAKATELEAFDTKTALKHHLNEGQPQAEDQQEEQEVVAGKKLMRSILEDFANQPLDTFTDEQIGEYISGLRDKVTAEANQFLITVLTADEPQEDEEGETDVMDLGNN